MFIDLGMFIYNRNTINQSDRNNRDKQNYREAKFVTEKSLLLKKSSTVCRKMFPSH